MVGDTPNCGSSRAASRHSACAARTDQLRGWMSGRGERATHTHTHFTHLQQRPFVDVVTHGHRRLASAVGAYCSSRARWALPLPLVHVRPRPPAPRPLHLLDIQPGAYMHVS